MHKGAAVAAPIYSPPSVWKSNSPAGSAMLEKRRAEGVSLLAEHEITRLVTLVTAMAQRMGINVAQDPELAELAPDVAPEKVLDTMEAQQRQSAVAESQAREP